MKPNLMKLIDYEQELCSIFKYYPIDLIEASLLTYASNKTVFVPEELTITQLFQQELKDTIQRFLLHYHQHHYHQEPIDEQTNLKAVIKILTAFIPIAYIFCNNPNGRNCSLTVVLHQHHYKAFEEVQNLIDFTLKSHHHFTCNVFTYGTMVDQIRRGHIYYNNLCTSSNCVYQSSPNFKLAIADPVLLASTKLKAIASFKIYQHKTNIFFAGAEQFFLQQQHAMAAFMLQQACEFTFNGILMVLVGKSIKSHDLLALYKQTSHYLPQLIGLLHHKQKKEIHILSQIQEAYVKARYDEHYQISGEEVLKLINATQQFIKIVQLIVKEQLS